MQKNASQNMPRQSMKAEVATDLPMIFNAPKRSLPTGLLPELCRPLWLAAPVACAYFIIGKPEAGCGNIQLIGGEFWGMIILSSGYKMLTTIEHAEKLTRFVKRQRRSADPVIDGVLDKLLERERQAYAQQAQELRAELAEFERTYGMRSSEFYASFEAGLAGDSLDFVDWAAAWRCYQTIRQTLAILSPDAQAD